MSVELRPDAITKLSQWTADKSVGLHVAVDAGATNLRVVIGHDRDTVVVSRFVAQSTRTIVAGFQSLAEQLRPHLQAGSVRSACMAVAGRVFEHGHKTEITNYPGGPLEQFLSVDELPAELFPSGHSRFINDLESGCFGLASLNDSNRLADFFRQLMPTHSADKLPLTLEDRNYLVMAAGTGLGVGVLIYGLGHEGSFGVMPTEGGHMQLNPLGVDHADHSEEARIISHIAARLYDGQKHQVEYEDMISGRGVGFIYEALRGSDPKTPPSINTEQIVEAAKAESDPLAVRALLWHYRYLARHTQNLALGLQVRAVFWAGDNQVNNSEFVYKHLDVLRAEFLNIAKSHWVSGLQIFSQIQLININLEGAMLIARNHTRDK